MPTGFYGTLSVIGVWGPLTPSKVAELTGTPLTTVSDRAATHGRGRRRRAGRASGDGRSHLVQLTEKGDAHWKQGWPHSSARSREVTANLERPVDEVDGSLEDLIEALRKGRDAR